MKRLFNVILIMTVLGVLGPPASAQSGEPPQESGCESSAAKDASSKQTGAPVQSQGSGFKRFMKDGTSLSELARTISCSECKGEDVFSAPDFSFQMGLPERERDGDCICVQSSDGKTIRVVGYIRKRKIAVPKRSARRHT